jgi:hypothetical protein
MINFEFKNKDSAGISFNGSFYFVESHVINNKYGSEKHFDEYKQNNPSLITKESLIGKPIGNYQHLYENTLNGIKLIKNDKQRDKSTLFPIVQDISSNKYIDVKESLGWIKDEIGLFIVDAENNYTIKSYNDFINKKITDQIVLGNMLVYDSKIVMKEELMSTAIAVKINGIAKGTRGMIYLKNGAEKKLAVPDDFITTPSSKIMKGSLIYFKPNNSNQFIETTYDSTNIMMPFNVSHVITENPGGYLGAIPPAMPMHASDKNPRTCVIIDKNNNLLVLNIEGRNDVCGGRGIDLFDLAKLCKELGAVHALNLDGGGSSQIFWKEKGNGMDGIKQSGNISEGNSIIISQL